MDNPAALIISYARDEGAKALIKKCIENGVKKIYVSIDGPKNADINRVQDSLVRSIGQFTSDFDVEIFILRHPINLGVGVGVISAIDWFFSQEESGHILEDDLEIDSGFFVFSRIALKEYSLSTRVHMISGTQIQSSNEFCDVASWTNYPMIWGWSSWRDKWIQMRSHLLTPKEYSALGRDSFIQNYWATGANRVLDGKVDTWDTPLAAAFRENHWICIIPPVNLVSNFGNDANASHTKTDIPWLNQPIRNLPEKIDFKAGDSQKSIGNYNSFLEKDVFGIKYKHYFLPVIAKLRDPFTYKVSKERLSKRISGSPKVS